MEAGHAFLASGYRRDARGSRREEARHSGAHHALLSLLRLSALRRGARTFRVTHFQAPEFPVPPLPANIRGYAAARHRSLPRA